MGFVDNRGRPRLRNRHGRLEKLAARPRSLEREHERRPPRQRIRAETQPGTRPETDAWRALLQLIQAHGIANGVSEVSYGRVANGFASQRRVR